MSRVRSCDVIRSGGHRALGRLVMAAGAAATLVGGLGAQPAAAQGGPGVTHNRLGTLTRFFESRCEGFDVRADVTFGQNNVLFFANDTVLTTGAIRAVITRMLPDGGDGASIAINFSGQGRFFDITTTVVHAHGPWEVDRPDDPTTTSTWEGELLLVNGNSVFDTTTGDVLSSTSPIRDLCAELT